MYNSPCDQIASTGTRLKRLQLQARVQGSVAAACSQPISPTFGAFVEVAFTKNSTMLATLDTQSVGKIMLQQQIWLRLQQAFFRSGIDAAAKAKEPVLLPHERHANCSSSCSQSKADA